MVLRPRVSRSAGTRLFGWGGRIRTFECRLQRAVPYRLATPHKDELIKYIIFGLIFQCTSAVAQFEEGDFSLSIEL